MATFGGGLTPAQYYAKLNRVFPVFNVEEYGAVHDNSTDDTAAIQSAITACDTDGGGVIFFPKGIYVIGGALVGVLGATTYNSQLTIPFVDNNNETRKTFHFLGEVCPNMAQSSGIVVNGITHITPSTGVILKSTITGSGINPSVICGGLYNATGDIWGTGNGNQVIIENIQIHPVVDISNRVTIGAINLRGCIDATVKNVACYPFNLNVADTGLPQNACVGIAMPIRSCGNHEVLENVTVGGFETGYLLGEHTSFKDTVAISCLYAYDQHPNYQINLGVRIGAYWCANVMKFSIAASYLKVSELQVEWYQGGKWFDAAYTILDPSNYGHGEVSYSIVAAGVGFDNSKFNKSGGVTLQCIPIAFAAASSFTVSGADDAAKLASLMTVLKAKGLITY